MAADVVSGTNFVDPHDAIMKVVPSPYSTPEKTVRSCFAWRALVNFAVFLGLAEVEPTTKVPYDRLYRVRKRPLLAEAVRFHIPG
ncbi:MAG: hypothetical protein ACYC37_01600 [Desulfobacteria bacterium]